MKTCTKCLVSQPEEQFSWRTKDVRRAAQCKSCHKTYRKTHYEDNRDKYIAKAKNHRQYNSPRWTRHGISSERWEKLNEKFDGLCWVCGVREAKVVDHDHSCCPGAHSCGKCVRGLLCSPCNTGIGMLGDTEVNLLKAVQYLRTASIMMRNTD